MKGIFGYFEAYSTTILRWATTALLLSMVVKIWFLREATRLV